MERKEFLEQFYQDDESYKRESDRLGREEGFRVYWEEEKGKGNPYQFQSYDWWLFEEAREEVGNDL